MDEVWRRLYQQGAAAWPEVPLTIEAFAPARVAHAAVADPATLDAAELYLACACAAGAPAALRAFEARYFGTVAGVLARLGLGGADVAEVEQELRLRLLIGEAGAPAKIVAYAGAGRLGGLIQVAATRAGLRLRARAGRHASDDTLARAASPSRDPAEEALRQRYAPELKRAFEQAIAELDRDERNLLRASLLDRLSIDALAAMFQIHRATAARRVAAARAQLIARVHARFGELTGVAPTELPGLAAVVGADLSLSLSRVLGPAT